MKLFKMIEIDIGAARARACNVAYSDRQKRALLKLYDLFEKGQWRECLKHVNSGTQFRYVAAEEYHEKEHICEEVSSVLMDLGRSNYFTQPMLLRAANARLRKRKAWSGASVKAKRKGRA